MVALPIFIVTLIILRCRIDIAPCHSCTRFPPTFFLDKACVCLQQHGPITAGLASLSETRNRSPVKELRDAPELPSQPVVRVDVAP